MTTKQCPTCGKTFEASQPDIDAWTGAFGEGDEMPCGACFRAEIEAEVQEVLGRDFYDLLADEALPPGQWF